MEPKKGQKVWFIDHIEGCVECGQVSSLCHDYDSHPTATIHASSAANKWLGHKTYYWVVHHWIFTTEKAALRGLKRKLRVDIADMESELKSTKDKLEAIEL